MAADGWGGFGDSPHWRKNILLDVKKTHPFMARENKFNYSMTYPSYQFFKFGNRIKKPNRPHIAPGCSFPKPE